MSARRLPMKGERKKTKGSLTAKSAAMYSQKINGYLIPAIGGMQIKRVRAAHLQDIVNKEAGKSFSHVNKLIRVINEVFHRAYVDRLIFFNPAEGLVRPNVEKNSRRSLTTEELAVLHAVADTHKHGLWVEFHLGFGVRPSEVPPILVQDLDFTSHLLHISKAVESGTKAVKDPKTEAGERYIPIPTAFEPELIAYTAGKKPTDYLFPGERGDMMTQSGITRRWRAFKRAMDIAMGAEVDNRNRVIQETSRVAKDLTLHCLRHTFCSMLGERGVDASIGRLVTGHADVATLSNIYTHTNSAILQLIADKINGGK